MGKNAKYRLSQLREDQFTAGTACRNTGNPGSNFFNPIIFLWDSRKDYTRNVRLDIEKILITVPLSFTLLEGHPP